MRIFAENRRWPRPGPNPQGQGLDPQDQSQERSVGQKNVRCEMQYREQEDQQDWKGCLECIVLTTTVAILNPTRCLIDKPMQVKELDRCSLRYKRRNNNSRSLAYLRMETVAASALLAHGHIASAFSPLL